MELTMGVIKKTRQSIKRNVMLSRMFRVHGQLCASRPWEVIFATITITVCLMSMSFFAFADKVCGWNYKCLMEDDTKSSDILVLTVTRCLAVMYIYLQFRNLRKLGSRYLLGIAAVFTIFSSFVFSVAVINMVGGDLTGLNEALPFFLLIIDLSKACTLAKFALSSKSQEEVRDNIGRGMAIIGPTVTLDSIVETLVIGVGTLSGVRRLETMCCFGCLSVIANYLAFMTFYPACLALVLELIREKNAGNEDPMWQIKHHLSGLIDDEEEKKSNPVTQRVKIIMSAGLVLVHIHKRLSTSFYDSGLSLESYSEAQNYIAPEVPLWKFYLLQSFPPGIDYIVTFVLAAILAMKYVFLDSSLDPVSSKLAKETPSSFETNDGIQPITQSEISSSPIIMESQLSDEEIELKRQEIRSKPSFIIGDDSSSEEEADKSTTDANTQTDFPSNLQNGDIHGLIRPPTLSKPRTLEDCIKAMNSEIGPEQLTDDEILLLVAARQIPAYKLETAINNHERGVNIRRKLITKTLPNPDALEKLPYTNYDYKYVEGACCENVLGYMPIPVGVAGPLLMDGKKYQVPMATTEGCLVASTNRGCRALAQSGGVESSLVGTGMTRAPVVRFPSARKAAECKLWLENEDNFDLVAEAFNSTTRYGRLKRIKVAQASRYLYMRFVADSGDAMGMNMLSKGVEKALDELTKNHFPDMDLLSLSGNYCTDKKPAAINWIEGRGKSVVCDAVIPARVVKSTLKTSVTELKELNIIKNLMGSAMAGSIGGYNAHAANIVTAIYIATGQDPAQNVASSNCMTVVEGTGENGEDLYISCTMPSIELGTIGGGTVLPPQASCLKMLGLQGSSKDEDPGYNANTLARVVCATVLAGELSLLSALAAGHLVKSHLKHNRSALNMSSPSLGSTSLNGSPVHQALMNKRFSLQNQDLLMRPVVRGTCINKAP